MFKDLWIFCVLTLLINHLSRFLKRIFILDAQQKGLLVSKRPFCGAYQLK